jgi:selenocysteine lyase/cysteine desulfurase
MTDRSNPSDFSKEVSTVAATSTAGLDFNAKRLHYRWQFPLLEKVIWLNHAGHSPWSIACVRAMQDFIHSFCEGPMREYIEWEAVRNRTRELLAKMLNAEVDEIGFNFNTSLSLALLTRGIDWKPGDNIIVADKEFPAVVMPAKLLEQWGVEARVVETVNGLVDEDKLLGAMDGRTRMMIVSLVNFLTGQRLDIKKLSKACRDAGVFLVVDAIQAAGPTKIDVKDLGCQALCFGSPKWMFGPMGVGTVYVDRQALDELKVPQVGMYSVPDPWNFFDYDQELICACQRFECGCPSEIAHHGILPNLEMFLDLGQENIERYLLDLTGRLHDELTRRGVKVITPRKDTARAAIVTFDAASAGWPDAKALADTLKEAAIVISVRMGLVRVSPHFYNGWAEIEKLLDVTFQ